MSDYEPKEPERPHLAAASPDLPAAQATIEEREAAVGTEAGLWRDAWHVLRRDPVFVVASGSFLDEMLRSAGARNRCWPSGRS